MAPGASHGPLPPKGKVLATYTDADGYTVMIRGGMSARETLPYDAFAREGFGRKGRILIIAPDGRWHRSMFFMGYPETTWARSVKRKYGRMSWEEKAALEVTQQATKYEPLKTQFATARSRRARKRKQ